MPRSGAEVADEVGETVERGTAVHPSLPATAPAADDGDVAKLGEAGERVPEGDDRASLRLVHLAEEKRRRELAAHPLHEGRLRDRPLPLRDDGAGRDEIRFTEILEEPARRPDERVVRDGGVANQGTHLAIVGDAALDLRR